MINQITGRWLPASVGVVLMLAACSSSTLTGSWKSLDFEGPISKVYVVGLSTSETNRRLFETRFAEELTAYGVTGIPSYLDLPTVEEAGKEQIAARLKGHGADSVLITRLLGMRAEETVTPGRVWGYRSWPLHGYPYPPHYRYWGSYYDQCCYDLTYEPPIVRRYEVATIEANLYQARDGELIWSAQLESVLEADLKKLVDDFIRTVIEDLHQQGLI